MCVCTSCRASVLLDVLLRQIVEADDEMILTLFVFALSLNMCVCVCVFACVCSNLIGHPSYSARTVLAEPATRDGITITILETLY